MALFLVGLNVSQEQTWKWRCPNRAGGSGRPKCRWEVCPLPYVLGETQVLVGYLLSALPALEPTMLS